MTAPLFIKGGRTSLKTKVHASSFRAWTRAFACAAALALAACATPAPEAPPATAEPPPPLALIDPGENAAGNSEALAIRLKTEILQRAPYKQFDVLTGAPNPRIGRAPGATCEALRFLAQYTVLYRDDAAAVTRMIALGDWILSIQEKDPHQLHFGGVPSTPDLAPPSNRYFYTIDAAFCGEAMFELARVTQERRFMTSALGFATFLVHMSEGPAPRLNAARPGGFCEFIVAAGAPLWNCNRYVKNLVALPFLRAMTRHTGDTRYEAVAHSAREFLLPGLEGAWEYAEANPSCAARNCTPVWRRIQGPYREPDMFVYGDTLAYSLRGLFEYEGLSPDVRRLYAGFSSFKGTGPRTLPYDGRIAFAGYVRPALKAPDEFSAYYDTVTLGLLHRLRQAFSADHFSAADSVLLNRIARTPHVTWRMDMDLEIPQRGWADLSTLASLGEAALMPRDAQVAATP